MQEEMVKKNELNEIRDIDDFFEEKRKSIMNQVTKDAEKTISNEMRLTEFELFYAAMVSQKEMEKTHEWLEKYRRKAWERALKIAKGNEEKAYIIYNEVTD